MSGRGWCNDKRIEHAVVFLLRCQGASVPEAIHAAKFTLEGRLEMAKQMVVRCAYAKAICGNMKLRRRWKAWLQHDGNNVNVNGRCNGDGNGDGSNGWRDSNDHGRHDGNVTAMAMDGATATQWQQEQRQQCRQRGQRQQ